MELKSLLDQSLQVNNKTNTLEFNKLNAELSLDSFAQQFKHVTQLKIASIKKDQGIQEKFLKSTLNEDVGLSKIDMQRHILQTNMVGHIGVVDGTPEAMELYIANAELQYKKKPHLHRYPLAMMVDCNSNPNGEPVWASVVITIDRGSSTASYEVTSSPDLKEEQRLALSANINDAFKFKNTLLVTGLAIEDYPDIKIAPTKYKTAEHGAYQVLHELYNNQKLYDLVLEIDNAKAFKEVAPESVKQAIVDQQIQTIKIEPQFFEFFKPYPQPQHPVVSEVIQDVKITDRKVTFPRVKPDKALAAEDYQTFILLLKEKFDSSGLDQGLNELAIKCFDKEALQGLAQLRGQASSLPFEKLTLELPETMKASDKAAFKFNLKLALMSLSESNLAQMQLTDTGTRWVV